MKDKINEIWPGWHTVELIGRGAFGEVFKVKKEKLGEVFYSAVKVIQIPQDENEIREMMADGYTSQSIRNYYKSIAKELMNEIKLLEELKSVGNVVNIEEFDICERKEGIGWEAFIRMELLKNLNEFRRGRGMTEWEVVKLGVDICEALAFCEKSNIIHRDIKPSNIFVDKYGNFKLGDFGIARRMEKTQSTISQKGTEKYMAPEVYFGVMESSYNIDIYSLGLVMYQLLNQNKLPFEPLDNDLTLYKDKEKALRRRLKGEPLMLPINASKELGEIIIKACEADKNKRYQSAQEMKKQLLRINNEESNAVRRNLKKGGEEKQKRKIIDDKTENAFPNIIKKREEKEINQKISKYPEDGDAIHTVEKIRPEQPNIYIKKTNREKEALVPANMQKGRKKIRLKGKGEQGKRLLIPIVILLLLFGVVPKGIHMTTQGIPNESESDPHRSTTYELDTQGDSFEKELTAGEYLVGADLPEGIYQVSVQKGKNWLSVKNQQQDINIYDCYRADAEDNDGFYKKSEEVRLYEGTYLLIEGAGTMRFETDSAQGRYGMRGNTLKENVVIKGTMTAGEDFPEGSYNIVCKKNKGKVLTIYRITENGAEYTTNYDMIAGGASDEWGDPERYWQVYFYNGMQIKVPDDMEVELEPSVCTRPENVVEYRFYEQVEKNYNAMIFVIIALASVIGCIILWKIIGFKRWNRN